MSKATPTTTIELKPGDAALVLSDKQTTEMFLPHHKNVDEPVGPATYAATAVMLLMTHEDMADLMEAVFERADEIIAQINAERETTSFLIN